MFPTRECALSLGLLSLDVVRTHLGTLGLWRDREGRCFVIVEAGVC